MAEGRGVAHRLARRVVRLLGSVRRRGDSDPGSDPSGVVIDSLYGPVTTVRDPRRPALRISAPGLPVITVRFERGRVFALISGVLMELVPAGEPRRRATAVSATVGSATYALRPTGTRTAEYWRDRTMLAQVSRLRSGDRHIAWLSAANLQPEDAALGHALVAVAAAVASGFPGGADADAGPG